jgi:hypothetical protein
MAMSDNDAADKAFAALHEIFSQPFTFQRYRRYDLKIVNGSPVFTLSEFDKIFEEATQDMPRGNELDES